MQNALNVLSVVGHHTFLWSAAMLLTQIGHCVKFSYITVLDTVPAEIKFV